jgi:cobalt-zinc-cadmium efflux system outer membrane protein
MWPGIEAMPPRAPQSMVVSPPTAASTTVRTTALRSVVVSFGAERQTAMQAATRRQSLPDPQTPGNPQIVALPPMVSDLSITATATGREPAEPVRQASAAVDAPPAIGPPAIPLENVQLAAAGAPAAEPIPAPHPRRLEVPPELPGANAPQIRLPPLDREHAAERAAAVAKLFPPLPPLGAEYQATALPQGTPLTLDDLEQMARQYSPDLRQAMANVRSAEGAMIQAGLYPNPTVGYESDDVGQGLTAGQQGGFVDQTIKTGGKLQLAKAAAEMDVANAQVALRKAQSGLAAKVRGAYFSTLVAEENVRVSHALARFSDEAYNVQVDMVKGGQAAAYEPLQLRVLAYQARASLVQARNRYVSAWKQLAAAMGVPGMPPAPLAGRVDAPVPLVRYDAALAHILATNSDVLTAENTLHQSQINLRLAQVNRIPDLDAHVVVERDYTTPPFGTIVGVQLGGPLPLWDHNQGNIMAAEAAVTKASEGPHFARDDLTSRLADAYERYQDNMKVIEIYRKWMLPDQVQAYRGAYQRHQTEPDVVAFADVVTAQQTLATTITSYVTQLGTLWQAVVDMGSLLEAEDLFHMGDPQNLPPVPDLAALCPLPCCHAYQPAAAAGWLGGDAQWPALAPGEKPTR